MPDTRRLANIWAEESTFTDAEAGDALQRCGSAIAVSADVGGLDEEVCVDLIRLCQYFRSRTPGAPRAYGRELWEAAKTLAPWTAVSLLAGAEEWRLSKETEQGRPKELGVWGERLARFASALTHDLADPQRKLFHDALRLPENNAGLPDSCVDQPVEAKELVLRFHTMLDNYLHDRFSISRVVLALLAAVGVVIIVCGLFSESGPPMLWTTMGLSWVAAVGATYGRRLVELRLSPHAIAASRAIGNSILGIAALQAVIVGVWVIDDTNRGLLAAALAAVAVTLTASVSAGYCAELASVQYGSVVSRTGQAARDHGCVPTIPGN